MPESAPERDASFIRPCFINVSVDRGTRIGDLPPWQYLKETTKEMPRAHFIPEDRTLWAPEKFGEFFEEHTFVNCESSHRIIKIVELTEDNLSSITIYNSRSRVLHITQELIKAFPQQYSNFGCSFPFTLCGEFRQQSLSERLERDRALSDQEFDYFVAID